MQLNTSDLTIARNFLDKYRFLIREYELVKAKQHPVYQRANDFYKAHDTDRRIFLKYYNGSSNRARILTCCPKSVAHGIRHGGPSPLSRIK